MTPPTDERGGLPSASIMERISLCPGSWLASRGMPEISTPEMKAYALTGDRIHAWMELPGFLDLTKEEQEIADNLMDQRDGFYAAHSLGDVPSIHEMRLWFIDKKGRKRFSGKLDDSREFGKRAAIVEFKTGWGDQTESPKNIQLRAQAVLLQKNAKDPFDEIIVAVIQPNVSHKPDVASYTAADLRVAEKQLLRWLDESEKPDAPRIPGPKQCKFCPAKLKCPEAQKTLSSLKVEELIGITGEDLSKLLDRCAVAQDIIDSARAQAKVLLAETPGCIPGWTLSKPGTKRAIPDAMALYETLFRNGLIDKDTFVKYMGIGVGDCETAIHEYRQSINAKMTKKEIKETLEQFPDLIVSSPKAPSLERI